MKRISFAGAVLVAGLLLTSCSLFQGKKEVEEPVAEEVVPPEDEGPTAAEVNAWLAKEVTPGMAREAIERRLGEPKHLSRTKEGRLYIMYEMADNYRSVVYDNHGKALVVYP